MAAKKCPRCGSSNVRRSHRQSSDPSRKSLPLLSQFFRCRDCRSRFSTHDLSALSTWGLGALTLLLVTVFITLAVRYRPATSEYESVEQVQHEATAEADSQEEPLNIVEVDSELADAEKVDTEEKTLDQAEQHYRQGIELLRRSAYREKSATLPRAAKQLRQAAEEGHVRAQLMLGVMHEDGSGVIQDYEQALEWYRSAAMQGEPMAMYRVGSMLSQGVGADKDLIKAYAWCNIAAARGHQAAATDRDRIAKLLSAEEIKDAQEQSRTFDQELPHRIAAPFILPAGL